MFEIPDDENFWEDLPLDEITNTTHQATTCVKSPKIPSIQASTPLAVLSTETSDTESIIEHVPKRQKIESDALVPDNIRLVNSDVERTQPAVNSAVLVPNTQLSIQQPQKGQLDQRELVNSIKSPRSSTRCTDRTPKRYKRKFPGPAGLLPKLGAQQNTDIVEVIKTPNIFAGNENEEVLPSSQSEDVFNELPWQTLIKDLGNDGQKYLKKFSITNSLQKSKKKLLPHGKVPLVMAVLETLDWQGSEASVLLKDKSGKVNGTVHGDIMKEYQDDLQVGSVLVLRQVGVISPTARNQYLNITPSNIVIIYSNKTEGFKKVTHTDQSLCSVIECIQKDMDQELINTMDKINSLPKTPRPMSSTGCVNNIASFQTPNIKQHSGASGFRFRTPQADISSRADHIPNGVRSPAPMNSQRKPDKFSTPNRNSDVSARNISRTPVPAMSHLPRTSYTQHGSVANTSFGNPVMRTPNFSHIRTPTTSHIGTPTTSHIGTPTTPHIGTPTTPHIRMPTSHIRTPANSSTVTPSASYRLNSSCSIANESTRPSVATTSSDLVRSQISVSNSYRTHDSSNDQVVTHKTSTDSSTGRNSFHTGDVLLTPSNVSNQSVCGAGYKSSLIDVDNKRPSESKVYSDKKSESTPVRNGFRFRSTKKSPNTETNSSQFSDTSLAHGSQVCVGAKNNTCENSVDRNRMNKNDRLTSNSVVNNATGKSETGTCSSGWKSKSVSDMSQNSSGLSPVLPVQGKFGTSNNNVPKTNSDSGSTKKVPCFTVESNWNDDLSDELLSQLSEEMVE